jgi:uncharacterized SAM-binding protein YcdF (DUF218 family)
MICLRSPIFVLRMMSDIAFAMGVPSSAIRLEEKARTTDENAIFSAALLASEGIKPSKIIIISKADHLKWAMNRFIYNKKLGPDNVYINISQSVSSESVSIDEIMAQMQAYIDSHSESEAFRVKWRLKNLKNGVRGVD